MKKSAPKPGLVVGLGIVVFAILFIVIMSL